MKNTVTLAIVCATLVLHPLMAFAHAVLISSSPDTGATIAPGSVIVHLHYNSLVDHRRSSVTLTGPDDAKQRLAVKPDSAPEDLNADAALATPGAYNIRWQVLAVDGHITRGDVPFTVKAH
jgi:copper resistance protein C